MNTPQWPELDDEHHEAWQRRVALVETLIDTSIDHAERAAVRQDYLRQHGVHERTIRNYLSRYAQFGAPGLLLYQSRRANQSPRIHNEQLARKIIALVEEHPHRTIPQLRRILTSDPNYAQAVGLVSDRTIYRFLDEHGLNQKQRAAKAVSPTRRAYHQFEALASMELVQGDARDGVWLPNPDNPQTSRKTYMFCWIDDYSRMILHARYYWDEKLSRLEDCFKHMVFRWGIPRKVYLDNGSAYVAGQFAFVLSQLQVRKIHHKPYQAWCKGKVEAVMKTVKNEFQSEANLAGFQTIEELNSALWAWIEVEYNRRNHSTTGEPPNSRFAARLPTDHRRVTDPAWFESLFCVRTTRSVHKYGIIKLEGNKYHTTAPHGTVIAVRYNPSDLSTVQRYEGDSCVETLSIHTLNNTIAERLPEESHMSPAKVSQASIHHFSALREQHTRLRQEQQHPHYSKLSEVRQS